MTAYVDTLALAKWYLNEARSEAFAAWIQAESEIHISTLTIVEMRCLRQDEDGTTKSLMKWSRRYLRHSKTTSSKASCIQHSVDDESVRGALTLLTVLPDHPMRTLDASHLSIARHLGTENLATADRVMIAAASMIGFDVVPFE